MDFGQSERWNKHMMKRTFMLDGHSSSLLFAYSKGVKIDIQREVKVIL